MSAASSSTLPHRTVALFALWVLLSESYTVVHMGIGLIAAFGVALLNTGGLTRPEYQLRWARAFAYFPWLFTRILASGVHLSYLILHPSLPIDPKFFRHKTRLGSEAAVAILGELSLRLRRTDELLSDAAFCNLPSRLSKRLLELAARYGQPGDNGDILINMRLKQQDLADMVGATRESVNKTLKSYKQREMISVDKGYITIKDLTGLQFKAR